MSDNFLAVDLGAESGRVILGKLAGGKLQLEELHRFPNQPVTLPTGLYWDTLRLWHEILTGLAVAGRTRRLPVSGVGVDTWGVDFALLGADGALVDNPRHYRDARNTGMLEKTFGVLSKEEIFAQTGVQFMQFNTLYQWHALKMAWSPALQVARTLLFMPDLFHYLLSGVKRAELTIASTSQFYGPLRGDWTREVLGALRLDPELLPPIVPAGTLLGPILPYVADQTGLAPDTPVYATASHDTAAAVAAVPAQDNDWCYISSGTWSLMGVELEEPVINNDSLELNFTNEIGVEGRVRFLKNIMGLWPLQECRRDWARQGHEFSYDQLSAMAAEAPAFFAVIDPDHFLEPGHMPLRIAQYCESTGQTAPSEPGTYARVILESLALRYRQVLESLERVTRKTIRKIHIVGGGSRNALLNQFVADCTGRTVIAGPAEATAAGNVLTQAMGAQLLPGLEAIRTIVRDSFEVTVVTPKSRDGWDKAYEKYCRLVG